MAQSSFSWDGRKINNIAEFKAYLATLKAPYWFKGICVHHTFSPTMAQWRGSATMNGLKKYYREDVQWRDSKGNLQRGWSAGPNIFNAPDGFWIGTPVNVQGVHSGAFNSSFIGIETVGDFDATPMPLKTRNDLFQLIIALFQWKGITQVSLDTVRGHRECGSGKSCPGRAVDLNAFRRDLGLALHMANAPKPGITRWQISREPCPVRISRDERASKALNNTATLPIGQIVDVDDITDGWLHLATSNPFRDLGFIEARHATRLS